MTPRICETESAKDTAINVLQAVNTMTKKVNLRTQISLRFFYLFN